MHLQTVQSHGEEGGGRGQEAFLGTLFPAGIYSVDLREQQHDGEGDQLFSV